MFKYCLSSHGMVLWNWPRLFDLFFLLCTCWGKKACNGSVFTSIGWVEGLCKQLSGKRVLDRFPAVKQQLWLLAFRKSRSDGFIWNPLGNSSLLRLWYLWMEFNKRNSLSIEALEHFQTAPTMQYLSKENWTDPPHPPFSPPLSFISSSLFVLLTLFVGSFFWYISSPNKFGILKP